MHHFDWPYLGNAWIDVMALFARAGLDYGCARAVSLARVGQQTIFASDWKRFQVVASCVSPVSDSPSILHRFCSFQVVRSLTPSAPLSPISCVLPVPAGH